jgi:hypothetical protein
MKNLGFLLVVFLLCAWTTDSKAVSTVANPDSTQNLLDKGKCQYSIADGRHKYLSLDYRGALNTFRGVLGDCPDNALAHFRIAECHYKLYNYDLALTYLDKAKNLKEDVTKELHYMYGQTYHRLGKIDEAIAAFEKFKTLASEKRVKELDVDLYIGHCKVAKELTAKPLDVTVANMGETVNSRNDDYSPLVSRNDSALYFVSRRSDTKGGNMAVDMKFFEDIYVCKREAGGKWGRGESLTGKVNTEEFDNINYLSADGKVMYIAQNIDRYTKSTDIAMAKLGKSGKWSAAKLVPKPVNSTWFDACPTLTDDESKMFFVSERQGGKGGADIYKVEKISKRDWGEPVLVESLNTPNQETTLYLHHTGNTLFFSSNRAGSMGGYDIFKTEYSNGSWSEPVNLGYPINTVNDETHFKMSADGKTGYFSSIRKDGIGDRDIYEVDLSKVPLVK